MKATIWTHCHSYLYMQIHSAKYSYSTASENTSEIPRVGIIATHVSHAGQQILSSRKPFSLLLFAFPEPLQDSCTYASADKNNF